MLPMMPQNLANFTEKAYYHVALWSYVSVRLLRRLIWGAWQHDALSWQKFLPVSCTTSFCLRHAVLMACYSSHSSDITLFGMGRAWDIVRSLRTDSCVSRACRYPEWDKTGTIDRRSQRFWRILPWTWKILGESLLILANQPNWTHFVPIQDSIMKHHESRQLR